METIAKFHREHLFVYSIRVSHVRSSRLQESTTREERSTRDVAHVEEQVRSFGHIVVSTSFSCETEEVDSLRALVSFVIVEAVDTPIASVRQRTRHESVELIDAILELSECALLVYVTIIVAVHDVAYSKFFVFPVRVQCRDVVFRFHVFTVSIVDEVSTIIEVDDFVCVFTYIVTYVDTSREFQTREDFVGVGRQQTIPHVVVDRLRHHHVRTSFASSIHLLDSSIVERTISFAEISEKLTIRRTIPHRAVGRSTTLARVARTTTDRHIERSRQRRFVVDLPLVVERNLRFVVSVGHRRTLLTIFVETINRIVAIFVFLASPFSHFVPFFD